jgi:uncharacterized membrane protein SpoIIM required for sporulation
MEWIEPITEWAKSNDTLLWWLFAGSAAFFLLTPIAVAAAVIALPSDYFTEKRRQPLGSWRAHPVLRALALALKNLLGAVLLVAGLLMLIVPGQGLLTVAVGLMLVDFPGKFGLERWLATRGPVWRSINWLRKRAGHEALKRPE